MDALERGEKISPEGTIQLIANPRWGGMDRNREIELEGTMDNLVLTDSDILTKRNIRTTVVHLSSGERNFCKSYLQDTHMPKNDIQSSAYPSDKTRTAQRHAKQILKELDEYGS